MTKTSRKNCPPGLQIAGRRLWRAVSNKYELRVDEFVLLENAARTLDLLVQIEDAMEGEPLVVRGSMGQQREHPLLSEARQQRALLSRLLAQMKLPDEGVFDVAGVRSVQARAAASKRWAVRG